MVTTLRLFLISLFFSALAFAEGQPEAEVTDSAPQQFNQVKKIDEEDRTVLQRHLPFYFVYGEPLSKLQFSFKSPVVRKVPLYFGFTQVLFWELREDSRPFRDLTYNPELFYRWTDTKWKFFESVDFGVWGHNSNGKKDSDSRSYEKQYLRFNFIREGHKWVTRLSTEFAFLNHFDKTNKNIQEYIGPLSLNLSFIQLYDSYIDKSEIGFKASPGGKYADRWDNGGYQISWAFRLGKIEVVPNFYFQYYHGYAETLLNYDKRVDEFRVGVLF